MKHTSFVIALLCLSACLLLVGCGTPSTGVAGTTGDTDTEKLTEPAETNDPTADTTQAEQPEETTPIPEPPAPEPVSVIGKIKNAAKVTEDLEAGTVTVRQKETDMTPPSFSFFYEDEELAGTAWAVTGTINVQTTDTKSGHVLFVANCNASNCANIFISRRIGGSNGIWRNITRNGVRTPASSTTNENVSNTLAEGTDWTGDFAFVYYEGRVSLYLKVQGGEFELMTYYDTGWSSCKAQFAVNQFADVVLSDLSVYDGRAAVKELRDRLDGVPEDPIDTKKILFIGNSATHVNNIPQTLRNLAGKAGYNVEVNALTKNGATLTDHANASTDHGKAVLRAIASGDYDIVVIQDNGNCVSSDAMRAASKAACKTLDAAIRAAGAKTYIYVRPPYGYSSFGYTPIQQCTEFDKLFNEIAAELDAETVYVNRAFARAMQSLNVPLWGPDNAHTSPEGAYLAVCVFFSTFFNTSSTVLEDNGLTEEVATSLQQVADKIVLEQYKPW